MIKIWISPVNFPEIGLLAPNFAFLDDSFSTIRRFSNNFPTDKNLGSAIAPLIFCNDATEHCRDAARQLSLLSSAVM